MPNNSSGNNFGYPPVKRPSEVKPSVPTGVTYNRPAFKRSKVGSSQTGGTVDRTGLGGKRGGRM